MNAANQPMALSFPADGPGRLNTLIESDRGRETFHFESRDSRLRPCNEALVSSTLVLAMYRGQTLRVEGAISRRFLEGVHTISEILRTWRPALSEVRIDGSSAVASATPQRPGVGLFFSAGLDSFYSLLKHRETITDLILVNGFEDRHAEPRLFQQTEDLVRAVGSHFGMNVVSVETDLRPFLKDRGVDMWKLADGSFLAAVGHLLAAEFRRIYIAATYTYGHLKPLGTHPLVDPLWSTEALEFVHDGAEATRTVKQRLIAADDFVLRSLRVCPNFPVSALNCGRCEKCLRTMIGLLLVGSLDGRASFDADLDYRRVARLRIGDESKQTYWEEYLVGLGRMGGQGQLIRAIRTALRSSRRRLRWRARLAAAPAPIQQLAAQLLRARRRLLSLPGGTGAAQPGRQ